MDKKAKKRDIASFASNLKDLLNTSENDVLTTLDRDIQHFIYGRVALLIKHNDNQPIGSLNDVGAVTGAALSSVIAAFCHNRDLNSSYEELFSSVKESMIHGFNARIPADESAQDSSSQNELVNELTEE